MIHQETYLAIIAILFLVLVFRRQDREVIIQRSDPNSGLGGWLFAVVLVLVWFIAGSKGCSMMDEPSEKEPYKVNKKNSMSEIKSLPSTDDDPKINTSPSPNRSNNGKGGNWFASTSDYTTPNQDLGSKQTFVFLRAYYDLDEANLLKDHFSQRNILVCPLEGSDEFWALISVNSQEEGEIEVRDWNRHKREWEHLGLSPKVVSLTVLPQRSD